MYAVRILGGLYDIENKILHVFYILTYLINMLLKIYTYEIIWCF